MSKLRNLTATQRIGLLLAIAGLVCGIAAAVTTTAALGGLAGLLGLSGTLVVAFSLDPTVPEPAAEQTRSELQLVDEQTGLLVSEVFELLVNVRVTTAKRYLRPLAVVLLEVDAEPFTHHVIEAITRAMHDTLRDCDSPCRLSKQTFGVILEDTPETGAVWAIERVRRHLQKQIPGTRLRAGIACYPAHSIEPDVVKRLAGEALAQAREWPQDRIEVATAE